MNTPNEPTSTSLPLDENLVRRALRSVDDPELGCNVVDLGLIYDVAIEGTKVAVKMTLTTHGCPMHETMVEGVRWAVLNLEGVEQADVELVWEPPWTPAMMTDEGKAMLGITE